MSKGVGRNGFYIRIGGSQLKVLPIKETGGHFFKLNQAINSLLLLPWAIIFSQLFGLPKGKVLGGFISTARKVSPSIGGKVIGPLYWAQGRFQLPPNLVINYSLIPVSRYFGPLFFTTFIL